MWLLLFAILQYLGWITTGSLAKETVEIDLMNGEVRGYSSFIQFVVLPYKRKPTKKCDTQAVIKINFSGQKFTGARFHLEYGDKPRLWTLDISDSPAGNGYGGDNGTTSNMAECHIFNRQFRIYGNDLPGYLDASVNGDLLIHVEDDIITKKNEKFMIDISNEKIDWARAKEKRRSIESKFLYTLRGQKPRYGILDNNLYAGFNRVVAGNFRKGSGLCKVSITLYKRVDECALGRHNCDKNAQCINTRRSYRCKCKNGFYGNGYKCEDYNECSYRNGDCVQMCTNTIGNYSCACHPGFKLAPDGFNCIDINECAISNGGCSHGCVNYPGYHECTCNPKFQLENDGKTCVESYLHNYCRNKYGCTQGCRYNSEWRCVCRRGYSLHPDGKRCVKPCKYDNGGCHHKCTDTRNGPVCSCAAHYRLDSDKKTCLATCEVSNGGCNSRCTDTSKGPVCSCSRGYVLHHDGKTCLDVDECLVDNGHCSHQCQNMMGSYQCLCEPGFKAVHTNCTDIDECSMNSTCDQICVNTPGSYECRCKKGYEQYGVTHCGDVNECSINNGGCQHSCKNTNGSFSCYCRHGYRLLPNKKDCEIIDRKCQPLKTPAKATLSCVVSRGVQRCTVSCINQAHFVSQPPSYTTECGAHTSYMWKPEHQSEALQTLPSCSDSVRAPAFRRKAQFVFITSQCQYHNGMNKTHVLDNFQINLKKILTGHSKYRCTEKLCDVNGVDIYCGSGRRKMRRLKLRDQKFIMTAEFELQMRPKNPAGKGHCDVSCVRKKTERRIKKTLRMLRKSINKEKFHVRIYDKDYEVSKKSFKPSSVLMLTCHVGEVLVKDRCVACSVGTYYDRGSATCMDCAVGTYQDKEGQETCRPCPGPDGTGIEGARNLSQCGGRCRPGYYSSDGFEECMPCPRGQYQPEYGRTHCISCGPRVSTRVPAAKSFQDCAVQESCKPGQFYDKSLRRCASCPHGTYQSLPGLDYCIDCPGETTTDEEGALNTSYCKDTKCGGFLKGFQGFIQSPNYPGNYPNNVDCKWRIEPGKGRRILVVIPEIFLESKDLCGDQLIMRKAPSKYSVVTYETCESTDRPIAFVARSRNLYITFKSDGKNTAKGFSIPYVLYDEEYQNLIEDIVKDGRLYSSEQHQAIFKDRTLLAKLLDVTASPIKYFTYLNESEQLGSSFIGLISPKVNKFFEKN